MHSFLLKLILKVKTPYLSFCFLLTKVLFFINFIDCFLKFLLFLQYSTTCDVVKGMWMSILNYILSEFLRFSIYFSVNSQKAIWYNREKSGQCIAFETIVRNSKHRCTVASSEIQNGCFFLFLDSSVGYTWIIRKIKLYFYCVISKHLGYCFFILSYS